MTLSENANYMKILTLNGHIIILFGDIQLLRSPKITEVCLLPPPSPLFALARFSSLLPVNVQNFTSTPPTPYHHHPTLQK